jgi:hypothetical protein
VKLSFLFWRIHPDDFQYACRKCDEPCSCRSLPSPCQTPAEASHDQVQPRSSCTRLTRLSMAARQKQLRIGIIRWWAAGRWLYILSLTGPTNQPLKSADLLRWMGSFSPYHRCRWVPDQGGARPGRERASSLASATAVLTLI